MNDRRKRYGRSIAAQQVRATVAATALLGLLISLVQIYVDISNVRTQSRETLQAIAELVGNSATEAAFRLDRGLAEQIVQSIAGHKGVSAVRLVDDLGETLAEAGLSAEPLARRSWLERLGASAIGDLSPVVAELTHDDHRTHVGTMQVWPDTFQSLDAFWQRALAILVGGMLKACILAGVLFLVYERLWSRRIRESAELIRDFARSGTDGGRAIRAGWLNDEITDLQRLSIAALRRARIASRRARLSELALDAAPCGIVVAELGGDQPIVYANKGFAKLTGYPQAEVIGENCRFLNRPIGDAVSRMISSGPQEDRKFHGVVQDVRKSGELFWNRLSIAEVELGDGRPTHFIGIQEDVSVEIEQKHDADAAREEMQAILTASPDAILTVDLQGRIRSINKAVTDLWGWEPAQIIGETIHILLPERMREHHSRLVQDYLFDPESQARAMTMFRSIQALHRDGHEFPVLVTLAPYSVRQERAVAVTVHNMTDLVESKESLELLTEELASRVRAAEHANHAKSQFLAHMSHDLRTPLNAVIGFAETIVLLGPDRIPKSTMMEYAGHIGTSGRHMLNMVNEILHFGTMELDEQELGREVVDVSQIAQEAVAATNSLDASPVVMLVDTGAVQAFADRTALRQCIDNLISNARKYSKADQPEIRVLVESDRDTARIIVEDRGIGIPDEVLERLGEPFVRASDPYVRNIEGTGLGLAITKALIERQRGQLDLRRREIGGTVAVITLISEEGLNSARNS